MGRFAMTQVYWWHEKYKPKKPKYYNRVHTGYEWNKYNQTHYDQDNPPPKVVQVSRALALWSISLQMTQYAPPAGCAPHCMQARCVCYGGLCTGAASVASHVVAPLCGGRVRCLTCAAFSEFLRSSR